MRTKKQIKKLTKRELKKIYFIMKNLDNDVNKKDSRKEFMFNIVKNYYL